MEENYQTAMELCFIMNVNIQCFIQCLVVDGRVFDVYTGKELFYCGGNKVLDTWNSCHTGGRKVVMVMEQQNSSQNGGSKHLILQKWIQASKVSPKYLHVVFPRFDFTSEFSSKWLLSTPRNCVVFDFENPTQFAVLASASLPSPTQSFSTLDLQMYFNRMKVHQNTQFASLSPVEKTL